MSDAINTGGTAFPVLDLTGHGLALIEPGITLRDYFAAKAMQGMCASNSWENKRLAYEAYDIADEMLRAREGSA